MEIETFVKLVEAGSMTAASRELGVPRSTVSRHLARLEDDLGVRLMQRTTRSLSLTEAGEEYYRRARRIVSELHEAAEVVGQMDDVPRGRLRVSAPRPGGDIGMAELVLEYCRRYPEVELEFLQTNRRVDLVAEGIDVAIRGGQPLDGSLIARRLGASRRSCLASPAYLEAYGEPTEPDDLGEHACLRGFIDDRPERSWPRFDGGSVPVSGRITTDDPDLLRRGALAGLGIACIPEVLAMADLAEGRLVRLLCDQVGSAGSVSVVYPAREYLPAKVRAFVDLSVELFGARFG